MSCKNCFDNCGEQKISDACVKYTGEDIPLLGICKGDTLLSVEEAVITALLSALDGTGITLPNINFTNAPSLLTILGAKSKTLYNLIQLLIDNQQTLKDLIISVTPNPVSFSTACLTGLPTNPTINDIVAATLTQVCILKDQMAAIPSIYVKQSELPSLVNTILTPSGVTTVQYSNRMVPYVAYEYYGSLSNFDNTGKGIVAAGFDKVFICNGNNNTPDKRGRVAVGATKNVPGPTLDAATNPTSTVNNIENVDYGVGQKFGENFHKPTVDESAPHTHAVVDPGHEHSLPNDTSGNQNLNSLVGSNSGDEGYSSTTPTGTSKTNITLGSSGGGKSHNVRQPSIAALFIMYRP